jgi:regulator of PEP synthase PpsR (kinase-PPPase family)
MIPHTIYLVSDGTCQTCEQVVTAMLVQFENVDIRLVKKPNVRSAEMVEDLIREAAKEHAHVFYTLVADESRHAIAQAAQQHMVPVTDLLGPVMVSLFDLLQSAPRGQPGLFHRSSQAQVDRIDAVEYTLEHDDGRGLHDLDKADVVLVGVSRASKSTTCFYLAYGGVRAANVPLLPDSEPPTELVRLDPRRVIGLTMNPHRLRAVRESRLRQWGMHLHEEYGTREQIARELRSANQLMKKHDWRCIDASYKAVEEIAREVRQLLAEAGIPTGVRDVERD